MEKLKSSIPGLSYPLARDEKFKTPYGFLRGRSKQDGAEGLWRIRDGLYDLSSFARNHPGGEEWITLTKNTDITELFESHHLTDKAERLLSKFYIKDATTPRMIPLTFMPDGFYRTFKKRALEALKHVDFHRPTRTSNLIADFLVITALALSLLAAKYQSIFIVIPAGIFLAWTTIAAHNYFHMRDNFRMYYFDLSLMSSKEWRITHAMSHHMYPNTLWDHEVYALEPFLNWLPKKRTNIVIRFLSQIYSPIVWMVLFIMQAFKRYYSVIYEFGKLEFRDVVPFFLPLLMSFLTQNIGSAFKTWLLIVLVASLVFSLIGFNGAHHHPDIFHDGDIYRDDLDWGLLELEATRDREVVDDVTFLALTAFGSHVLHHLLPTVDHCHLPLALPAFIETCKEFNICPDRWTSWELLKGQFKQLVRTEPRKNQR